MKPIINADIKAAAKHHKIKHWEIADKLGVSEATYTRKLRRELPAEEKAKIMSVILSLAVEREENI